MNSLKSSQKERKMSEKLNSIILKFTDLDEENARMEVILDPVDYDPSNVSLSNAQPCVFLAFQCVKFLNDSKEDDEDSEEGEAFETIH